MRLTRTTAALALVVLCTLFTNEARAHVGWGIVLDQQRQIYFADVLSGGTVWKIDAQGRLTPFVIGKHSHGLAIDATNNIYGEHVLCVGARSRHLGRAGLPGAFENRTLHQSSPNRGR